MLTRRIIAIDATATPIALRTVDRRFSRSDWMTVDIDYEFQFNLKDGSTIGHKKTVWQYSAKPLILK